MPASSTPPATVAVLGCGALGLVAIKNLIEEGFDVTGFDRNDYPGGLWKYTEDEKTSVLKSTIVNISKERGCFTDFPFPDETSSYPTAAEVHEYLLAYCKHFNLEPHFRLGTEVISITRHDANQQWVLHLKDGSTANFDKVVWSTGTNATPKIPKTPGVEKFEGRVLHSQAFKRPSDFSGKSVLVVGFANTAADTATQLASHAKNVYIAHDKGNIIMPRHVNGKAIDHSLTMRIMYIQEFLTHYFPATAEKMFNSMAKGLQDKAFTLKPEWKFSPAPSLKQSVPIVSDDLVPCLEAGTVKSVAGLKEITGAKTVLLSNGTSLEVDTIIYCTGYHADFSALDSAYDPTKATTPAWSAAPGSNDKPLPRLYQNVFSLVAPNSLAFLGAAAFPSPAFQLYDLATMAIAQVWKGASPLPTQREMEKAVDAHHEWVVSLAQKGSVYPGIVQPGPWMRWVNDTAGTGVSENLGYGMKGWGFWWKDSAFCKMCLDGIQSPHIYRVFDGKRKKWEGARDAIEKVNRKK